MQRFGMRQSFDHIEHGGPVQQAGRESAHKSRAQGDPSSLGDYMYANQHISNSSVFPPTFSCCANIGRRLVFSMRQGFSMPQCFCMRQGFWMRQCFRMRHCFFTFLLAPIFLCILPAFLFSIANNLLAQIF